MPRRSNQGDEEQYPASLGWSRPCHCSPLLPRTAGNSSQQWQTNCSPTCCSLSSLVLWSQFRRPTWASDGVQAGQGS